MTLIKCTDCDYMLDTAAAQAGGGLCPFCIRLPASVRADRRGFEQNRKDGRIYVPSELERSSAEVPPELVQPENGWELEPEYYADEQDRSVWEVLLQASKTSEGYVFLVSKLGGRLNLSFNHTYGVIEYEAAESSDARVAYTSLNMRAQVAAEQQLTQACPCCGVGMLTFASHYHMPRTVAFDAMHELLKLRHPTGIAWLQTINLLWVGPGFG